MSRIEKAMERAAQVRNGAGVVRQPLETAARSSIVHTAPLPDMVVNKVMSDDPLLVSLNDPASPVAEEYRKLKAILVKMTSVHPFKNVLMVTSAIPNEGSLTSLNLAISLAQEYDHTVLLLDADCGAPVFTVT